MQVLIIGSGGREHALGWKIQQSPLLEKLYFSPGNPGTAELGQNITFDDNLSLIAFCQEKGVDLVVVGPEQPLVEGLADDLRAAGVSCFGPGKAAARLEGSKAFAKEIMASTSVPTASYQDFTDFDEAWTYAQHQEFPLVIKADGLAGGKGVTICNTPSEARQALEEAMLENRFGSSGDKVVIESFLVGREASFHVICDGKRALPLVSAQDHKALFEKNKGPNTGGMGTFAPSPHVTEDMTEFILQEIANPVLDAMAAQGSPFRGVLFVGLMLTWHGPKVLEFNVRFGDPETQVMMPLIQDDLLPILKQAADGQFEPSLRHIQINSEQSAVCVICAAEGYPQSPVKGDVIEALPNATDESVIFHAGTNSEGEDLVTSGGRVLGVTAWGPSLDKARSRAYKLVDKVHFRGKYFRKDIGGHE